MMVDTSYDVVSAFIYLFPLLKKSCEIKFSLNLLKLILTFERRQKTSSQWEEPEPLSLDVVIPLGEVSAPSVSS